MTRNGAHDPDEAFIVSIDEDLEGIVPNFLKNREKDIQSISRSLDAGDFEAIRIIGHGMKGSGSGYGFDGISRIGEEIETGAKERNEDEIRELVRELSTYLDRVEVVYE